MASWRQSSPDGLHQAIEANRDADDKADDHVSGRGPGHPVREVAQGAEQQDGADQAVARENLMLIAIEVGLQLFVRRAHTVTELLVHARSRCTGRTIENESRTPAG